jgi:hypothetical protein
VFFCNYYLVKFILIFVSFFFKKEKNSQIYFLSENASGTNIRLIKIAKALNIKKLKPTLIINKRLNNYKEHYHLFKNIIYYDGYFELAKIILKIRNNPLHAFMQGNIRDIFVANICKSNNFFFDNYDQLSEILENNLKSVIEKLIIYNSINICRSTEISLLTKKKINHIFFTDYISELNTSYNELKKKRERKNIKICYVGKIKEYDEWQNLNSFDPNMNETILWFSKFKKISLHIFPSYLLSQKSRKKYSDLCMPYKNIFFNKSLNHKSMLKKIKDFDCGIVVFPIVNWPNKMAQKKYVYAMGNKIFDYLRIEHSNLLVNFFLIKIDFT